MKKLQRPHHPVGQHRRADGRLVPQGDQVARGPEGPEVAHRRASAARSWPSSAWCRSRSPAATSIRRWSAARIDAAELLRPATTTRSSASRRSRKYYYYPGFWEGNANVSFLVNLEKWNALPADPTRRSSKRPAPRPTRSVSAKYDHGNPDALLRLAGTGAELRPVPAGGDAGGVQGGLSRSMRELAA